MRRSGWRLAALVAAVYAHFLIFAQFSWVELLRSRGISAAAEKGALGAMAMAGVAAGFLTARRAAHGGWLRPALGVAAVLAAGAPWLAGEPWRWAVSILSGAAIGVMTVSLAPRLPRWGNVGWVGLGTGLGYALCNLPFVFQGGPRLQAIAGAIFAAAGAAVVPSAPNDSGGVEEGREPDAAISRVNGIAMIAAFTALVWLDSAAFFVIQHQAAFKQATWGDGMLWRNAALHLAAAVLAGVWLRRGAAAILGGAWALLGLAALALGAPHAAPAAGWLYPVGVSLYSTALVAWPGYLSGGGDDATVARRAAWVFAIAGWFGSANGIGMAESLERVPGGFIVLAGSVVLGSLALASGRKREAAAVIGVLALAWPWRKGDAVPLGLAATPTARGKAVYLAEGCIHCHSRYVRPGSSDETRWGPAAEELALTGKPVLVGNRRQGPDLQNVGARRSARWLELHFRNPRDFAPDSPMPSYAHLFDDGGTRGADLIAWLQQAPDSARTAQLELAAAWRPVKTNRPDEDADRLFVRHCALCHGGSAHGDGRLAKALDRRPADLVNGPFAWTREGDELVLRIGRVIKFGLPGTDMPGHEAFSDEQVIALAEYVAHLREAGRGAATTPPKN